MILQNNTVLNDRLIILSKLAEGGMAVIYLAEDKERQEEVVLKLLKPEQIATVDKIERFFQEFELLKSFNCPNIANVYERFSSQSFHYYSMPFLKGKSLSSAIKDLQLIEDKKQKAVTNIKILLQLAEALKYIHAREIIHHDLNPNNIFLLDEEDQGKTVKLLDFGISLFKGNHTADQSFAGTLHYKAPEQSKHKVLDFTSDIYAFGAIAYELFTGEKPFDLKGENVTGLQLFNGIVMMHNFRQVPKIKQLPMRISKTLNRMVQICMEKEPAHRYQNMQQIIDRLIDLELDLGLH